MRSALFAVVVLAGARALAAPPVSFNDQIRPILARNCVQCHGPDEKNRKGGLRLDLRDGAFADRDGTRAFVPGKPADSEALRRMTTTDADDRMPPAKTGKRLTAQEIALVRLWIEQGAKWEEHWSFTALARPQPPAPRWPERARNPIDAFVQARLADERLEPSPPADPITLARRVSLDLTGLPPAPDEVEAFARAPGDAAYEALVDRLLASPGYGERWARVWLDLARYADSKGYEKDRPRTIWRYRDWVIDAFNRDLPYTDFTVQQIAGDLLPGATSDQVLATAFHRNTLTNDEGGTDDEEFRVAAVKDRVDVTMQVWMGLTMGCARCHDHKYDPISQRDYYRLFAFFNQTEDADRTDDAPLAPMPTAEQRAARARIDARLAALDGALDGIAARAAGERRRREQAFLARWRKPLAAAGALAPAKLGGWRASGPLGVRAGVSAINAVFPVEEGEPPRDWREADLPDGKLAQRDGGAGTVEYLTRTVTLPGPRTLRATVVADEAVAVWVDGRLLHHGPPTATIAVPLSAGEHRLLVKLANGEGRQEVLFRLDGEDVAGVPLDVARALLVAAAKRTPEQRRLVRDHFLRQRHADGEAEVVERAGLVAEAQRLDAATPRVPVMRELPAGKRRTTWINVRGNFLEHGDAVTPATPPAFPPLSAGASADRLGLARWLLDERNPLTARVAVNRLWAQLFGAGLVETEEDFGTQGAAPTHRALLDWLATEYVRLGWSQKHLLRTIVLSHTYRQSARVTPALAARDRFNRLLARGPRVRLDAETLRDTALATAGLLSRKLHGPSVMPPQPDGIWSAVYSGDRWITSAGDDRWRRGLYIFIRRSSPYPSMIAFDAPSREVCSIRRIRSNTPLQALVTLNDPVYVEAAQALARRMMREVDAPPARRIAHGFRVTLLRAPRDAELAPLVELYARRERWYRAHAADARAMATEPLGALPDGVDVAEVAALTAVANVLLNTDEFLTKG